MQVSDLVEGVITYLHQSHDYYINVALVGLASSMDKLIEPCPEKQKSVIWRFFENYKAELDRHFAFEEGEVIPYVKELVTGNRRENFSINDFEDNHSNVEEKLSDLKNIISSSLPEECDPVQKSSFLHYVDNLHRDIERHTSIEDNILVPLVRLIEGSDITRRKERPGLSGKGSDREPLSDREKEVLACVARGMMNKEIADELKISINTVITHRKNITRKTEIKTVPGLTVYAILNNLVDINSIE